MKLTPEELRVCRSSLGITQGDLARRAGISSSFLSAIERDERRMTSSLESRILAAFKVGEEDIREFVKAHEKLIRIAGGG